jgi:hypothetical protein
MRTASGWQGQMHSRDLEGGPMYTTNWYEVETNMPVREADRLRAAAQRRRVRAAQRAGMRPAVVTKSGPLAAAVGRVRAGPRKAVQAIGSWLARPQRLALTCRRFGVDSVQESTALAASGHQRGRGRKACGRVDGTAHPPAGSDAVLNWNGRCYLGFRISRSRQRPEAG